MLARPVDVFALSAGWVVESKWDGFRVLLAHDQEQTLLCSRHGTALTPGFPELVAAAAQLPYDVVLDGELVIGADVRLAFEYLTRRLNRRPATAARLAEQHPAHFVAQDVDLTARTYVERRAALEALFAEYGLGPPWTLCPMTTDEATARQWLSWSAVGIEGVVFKRQQQPYLPGKRAGGWRKYGVREFTEAIVGAVTGFLRRPGTLLLGRFDAAGRLRYVGRTTQLAAGLGTWPRSRPRPGPSTPGPAAPSAQAGVRTTPSTSTSSSPSWSPRSTPTSRWTAPAAGDTLQLRRPRADPDPADVRGVGGATGRQLADGDGRPRGARGWSVSL
ncbi:ATP-dependent DNA ligase [Streptomyces purpurogeneiscleroticus]|uniref:ATP-dependent DNA ligase n=1 Tax=Streptomyces purpurogeneiscleroticus TaxID=68259 RepID=UPI001CBDF149|nr:ATP-dependent DNA ligase [Streptomyces purpurogeneiscleroticus]